MEKKHFTLQEILLTNLCKDAKSGDPEAIFILKHNYNLKVYTHEEITQINRLISSGMPLDQAIKELKNGKNHNPLHP